MKNMKRLLAAMAALGFTTVAAVNVVACNPKNKDQTNDLTKSFSNWWYSILTEPDDLENMGLTVKSEAGGIYTFAYDKITYQAMQKLVVKNANAIPVNRGVTVKIPSYNISDMQAGDQVALLVAQTKDGDIVATGREKTIELKVALKLFKAIKQSDGKLEWVDQNTKMDVTIIIDTVRIFPSNKSKA